MKIILTIFAGLMLLIGGGCTIALAGAGPLLILRLAIFGLNAALLATLYGKTQVNKAVFLALTIADFLIAAAAVVSLFGMRAYLDTVSAWAGLVAAIAFAVKGALTESLRRQLKRQTSQAGS